MKTVPFAVSQGFVLCMAVFTVTASLQNVIVVGGGVAGLAAARTLLNDEQNKFQVQVFEAKRERYGGRVWTKRNLSANSKDIQADIGASLINSQVTENLLIKLAQKFEIDVEKLGPSLLFNSQTEKKHQGLELSEAQRTAQEVVLSAIEKVKATGRDISVGNAINQEILHQGLREGSLIVNLLKSLPFYSISNFSSVLYSPNFLDHGYDSYVKFGFAEIIDRLVGGFEAEAPLDIYLRQIVRQIEVVKKENRVIVRSLGGAQVSVDAVIIAVPLTVLKNNSLLFDPPLPPEFRKTFNQINIVNSERIIFEFDEMFWPETISKFTITPEKDDEEEMFLSWLNLYNIYNKPYLVTSINHNTAEAFLNMSNQEVIDLALHRLSKLFGENVVRNRNVTNILRSDWLNSLHIGGASVYPAVGSTEELWDVFSEPHCPGIYFAGDFTSLDGLGTVHAAYYSGVRAAEALMSGFCEKKAREEEERQKREELKKKKQNETITNKTDDLSKDEL